MGWLAARIRLLRERRSSPEHADGAPKPDEELIAEQLRRATVSRMGEPDSTFRPEPAAKPSVDA